MPRFARDKRDLYYREAKVVGFRARSAYKLLQLHDVYGILDNPVEPIRRIVDLCAAPGSWSQVLARKFKPHAGAKRVEEKSDTVPPVAATVHVSHARASDLPRAETASDTEEEDDAIIVAVDLQEMAPIDGVITLQGDITSASTATKVISYFGGKDADLVICDGAPDVTGLHDIDEYVHSQLLLAAWNITSHILRPGGTFVAKMFKGPDMSLLYAQMRIFFKRVDIVKPTSSRVRSIESFLVCRDYVPLPGYVPSMETPSYGVTWVTPESEIEDGVTDINKLVVPFIAIGDLVGVSPSNPLIKPAGYDDPPEYENVRRAQLQARIAHYEALLSEST